MIKDRLIPGDQNTGGSDDWDVGVNFTGDTEPILTLHKLLIKHSLIFFLRVNVSSPEEMVHIKLCVSTW